MASRGSILVAPTTGGLGGETRGTIYLHVATGFMAVKTDNVTGGAWAVSFMSTHNPIVTAWGSADALTEDQADALIEDWIAKLPDRA